MKNIIFIAPPAAGKGTQSNMLKEKYGYYHVSAGDLLRKLAASNSDVGKEVKNIIDKGDFVSDDLVIDLIKKKLIEIDGKPFILDGFPRTLYQAKKMDEFLDNNYEVIYLNLDKDIAIKRIEGRLTCSCGKTYNLNEVELQPKVAGICDKCGNKLIKRDDDNLEAYIIRFDNFLKNTRLLIDYYQEKNKLHIVDVNRNINDIFKDISRIVAND